jgi:uncharacterized protein YndB with AHSA1/START domain
MNPTSTNSKHHGADAHDTPSQPHQEFEITRDFAVARERVFSAWTEPSHLECWWAPRGFTTRVHRLDLWPGGMFHYELLSPNAADMWGRFIFREIVAPARLVFLHSFSDEIGGIARHPLSAGWPLELLSIVTFAEFSGTATLTLRCAPHAATELERKTFETAHEAMHDDWTAILDKLAAHLERR